MQKVSFPMTIFAHIQDPFHLLYKFLLICAKNSLKQSSSNSFYSLPMRKYCEFNTLIFSLYSNVTKTMMTPLTTIKNLLKSTKSITMQYTIQLVIQFFNFFINKTTSETTLIFSESNLGKLRVLQYYCQHVFLNI